MTPAVVDHVEEGNLEARIQVVVDNLVVDNLEDTRTLDTLVLVDTLLVDNPDILRDTRVAMLDTLAVDNLQDLAVNNQEEGPVVQRHMEPGPAMARYCCLHAGPVCQQLLAEPSHQLKDQMLLSGPYAARHLECGSLLGERTHRLQIN